MALFGKAYYIVYALLAPKNLINTPLAWVEGKNEGNLIALPVYVSLLAHIELLGAYLRFQFCLWPRDIH